MLTECLLNAQSRGGGFPEGGVAEAGRRSFTGHFSDAGIIGKSGEEGIISSRSIPELERMHSHEKSRMSTDSATGHWRGSLLAVGTRCTSER